MSEQHVAVDDRRKGSGLIVGEASHSVERAELVERFGEAVEVLVGAFGQRVEVVGGSCCAVDGGAESTDEEGR